MNRLVGSLKKEKNMTLFYMLDTIDLAMQKKKKIEFDYLTKDSALTHFVVTPMSIIQINYHYYVVCSNHPEKQNIIFRVKDMKNLL
jgi:predicted DNA-binding transcriptional regulator YafY